MPRFLLTLGGADLDKRESNPAFAPAMYERYAAWLQELKDRQQYVGSYRLTDDTGARLSVRGGQVVEGPFVESKEAAGGVYILQAASLRDAVEAAKRCPIVDLQNGYVEVRLVDERFSSDDP